MGDFDHAVDFLIVGSGAAAMTAAVRAADLGLSTLLVEKCDHHGGSTAMGDGIVWVGHSAAMRAGGVPDSEREALIYLEAITAGEADVALLETYVEQAPRMLDYLTEHSHVRFVALTNLPDHRPEEEGGKPGGRSLEPAPFDASALGEELTRLRAPPPSALHDDGFMQRPSWGGAAAARGVRTKLTTALERVRHRLRASKRAALGRDPMLTGGNALVAQLRLSLVERDVALWLDSRAESLIVEEGRVVGAEVERDGGVMRVGARRGVLLAAGGFARNRKMRERHGPKPASTEWSATSADDDGDGIRMGMLAGAGTALLDDAWWTPVTRLPSTGEVRVLASEPRLPGSILVNGRGQRFTNEAAPPGDVGRAIYTDHRATGCSVPCWLIFDARFRSAYRVGPLAPGAPDRDGLLRGADTLAELAQALDLEASALQATVERFNAFASSGEDVDFARGVGAAQRHGGDARVTPNPCMAPLSRAPYYAIAVYPGDVGTRGGLRIDAAARVTDNAGTPIAGLYAAGHSAASIMGRGDPGAGGGLGPGMLLAFLAAEHAAGDRDDGVA